MFRSCLALVATVVVNATVLSGTAAADEYESIRGTLATCAACHGDNGASANPDFPNLAGQHLHYLYVQLKDYKSGLRKNTVMTGITAGLEKKQMLLLAQYFSEQPWPEISHEASPEVVARAQSAATAGQCVQCHRGGYEGDSRIPRTSNQHAAYLEKTMVEFKTRVRDNSPSKSTLFASFEDDDLKAMAEYMAGLKAE